jgi:hypothetical protein
LRSQSVIFKDQLAVLPVEHQRCAAPESQRLPSRQASPHSPPTVADRCLFHEFGGSTLSQYPDGG